MDFEYIIGVMSKSTEAMRGKDTIEILSRVARDAKNMKQISLDDQFLIGAMLGHELHQSYCDGRRLPEPLPNGLKNNPRIKELNQPIDQNFVKDVLLHKIPSSDTLYVEDGKVFMDIANTSFEDLSPYWQQDNFMAGTCAARSVITNWDGLNHNNPEVREYVVVAVANAIHESWIARGNVSGWNADLATAYINLPVVEQDKDLEHYRMATRLLNTLQRRMTVGNPTAGDDTPTA